MHCIDFEIDTIIFDSNSNLSTVQHDERYIVSFYSVYRTLYYATLYYTTMYYATLYHATLYYTTLYHAPLYYTTLYHAPLYHTTLHIKFICSVYHLSHSAKFLYCMLI